MKRWSAHLGGILLLGCSVALSGCQVDKGPPMHKLTGKLSDKGNPLSLNEKGPPGASHIALEFYPVGADGKLVNNDPKVATVEKDGTFKLDGIGTGKFKVVVHQWNPYPDNDVLKNKFSKEKSTIIRDVSGDASLDIDISNPK